MGRYQNDSSNERALGKALVWECEDDVFPTNGEYRCGWMSDQSPAKLGTITTDSNAVKHTFRFALHLIVIIVHSLSFTHSRRFAHASPV